MNVVFDANVVASAVCWQGDPWLCLVKLGQRQAFAWGTEFTVEETRRTCLRLIEEKRPRHNAVGRLTWYLGRIHLVEPAPLGKRRSRDPKDDAYIACALAAQAEAIVTFDKDLLVLQRPFGVRMMTPIQFLTLLRFE